jgi:hypothetical protein
VTAWNGPVPNQARPPGGRRACPISRANDWPVGDTTAGAASITRQPLPNYDKRPPHETAQGCAFNSHPYIGDGGSVQMPNRRARSRRRACPGTELSAGETAADSFQDDVRRAGHQTGGSSRVRDITKGSPFRDGSRGVRSMHTLQSRRCKIAPYEINVLAPRTRIARRA